MYIIPKMFHPIKRYGDMILERPCKAVTEFGTDHLRKLVADLMDTMYCTRGAGCAAPQIGWAERVAVVDPHSGREPESIVVLINPELVTAEGEQTGPEGCLSLPGFQYAVTRPERVVVRNHDVDGGVHEVTAEGFRARAIQHEMDHLDGKLYVSHLSQLKRVTVIRRVKKLAKAGRWM